ncbi:Innexin unc-7 [Lamellibrachia satsuma]|nr:Innexin unc-7 [Lamellibrachia satsuma]
MYSILTLIFSLPETKWSKDDDFADRMSCRYSVVILVILALTLSVSDVVREPITCWAPPHFADSHEKYANSYCWVRNTYYLPWNDEIPRPHEERQTIPYYQWMSLILLGQALLFYLPTLMWHGFNSRSGIDADNILETAQQLRKAEDEKERGRMLTLITNQMDRFLATRAQDWKLEWDVKHLLSATLCRCCGRR